MKISERFKQELQLGNVEKAIEIVVEDAMTLEIVTWVADDADEPSENGTGAGTRKPGHQIRTKINLLDGTVENQIGKFFLDGEPYANLRAFHLQQVEASKALIEKKVASLQILKEVWLGVNRGPVNYGNGDRAAALPSNLPPNADAETPQDNIEFILGTIFSANGQRLESPLNRPDLPTFTAQNGIEADQPLLRLEPDAPVSESINLQIDLSLDELMADLFTDDDLHSENIDHPVSNGLGGMDIRPLKSDV
jgi:hypothetical protein